MNAPTLIAHYNPSILSDEDFLDGFVARGEVADLLLRRLGLTADRAPAQAQLLVGGRGMGKTTLLRRVAIGVAEDEALRERFVPLRFREEQYNVLTLADFWRNCAESFAEWCETNRPASGFPRTFDRLSASLEWRDAETVYEAFSDELRALALRPLLLVDNLDLVISNISDRENWALRRALQESDGPALIGAATHVPAATGNRESAFYEFFRLHVLKPLSDDELIHCLRRLAGKRGATGALVARIVDAEPQRLHALHTFTGGNPRMLALIYRLLESQSTHEAIGDLDAVLDQLTPYYKSRVEEYQTKLQRAMIDALALNWDPISAHDLAATTGIEVTTVSSQLNRLRNDGLIEEVELSGARAGYQMVERLFNIWYLMRHGARRTRSRVTWLTKFLVLFYPEEELRRMSADFAASGLGGREIGYYREALVEAMEDVGRRHAPPGLSEGADDREARAIWGEIIAAFQTGRLEDAVVGAKRLRALSEAALGALAHVWTARAIYAEGSALGDLGRADEAIAAYDEVLARFGEASEPALHEWVAKALGQKGFRLAALGRTEEAIAACDEALGRYRDANDPALREQVAKARVIKGYLLGKLGRADEAIAAYEEALARFGEARDSALRQPAAFALLDKGLRLGELGRAEEEIVAYDEVVARFGEASESALREIVAAALIYKGAVLAESFGLFAEAAVASRQALEIAPDRPASVKFNLAWAELAGGDVGAVATLRPTLCDAPKSRLDLLDAGLELVADNFGAAVAHLDRALSQPVSAGDRDDLIRFLRLAYTRGYGEKLIAHFEAAGHAERLAPVYAALLALVRGERQLLNVNPETRGPAQTIYRRLVAPLRAAASPPEKLGPRRGRPPKRRGR